MPDPVKVYETRVSGLWNARHELLLDGERQGVLQIHRRWYGAVDRCVYLPEKGSVLEFRREPGLLRGQFTLWAPETHEWLGSSVRFGFFRREIEVSTGGKPYRLVPRPGLGRGWVLNAPKTGEIARITVAPFGRAARIEVYRRLDFMLLLMAYGIGSQILMESFPPGPSDRSLGITAGGPAKA